MICNGSPLIIMQRKVFGLLLTGMTFSLTGYDAIPNDGSGCVLITDIVMVDESIYNFDNNISTLFCRSEVTIHGYRTTNWFLHPTELSINTSYRIVSPPPDQGWSRNRGFDSEDHQLVRLWRNSATVEEGVFTCHIDEDNNTPRYLGVYHPSELVWVYYYERERGEALCT